MKKRHSVMLIIYIALASVIANSYLPVTGNSKHLFWIIPVFLLVVLFAGVMSVSTKSKRLKVCCHGAWLLLIFEFSTIVSLIYHNILAVYMLPDDKWTFIWSVVLCVVYEAIVFWVGIACVYLTSVQLGVKLRIIGIVCGFIPIVNLIVMNVIIRIALKEVRFEAEKERVNNERKEQQVCKTKYPILLVHGVFFRDSKILNYWGRIPKELEKNGADVYYGNHQSARAVAKSAEELMRRIEGLVKDLDCEKVNIIAHSKGGLDCRYAISMLGASKYVASLTTINTPHRGCVFAEYLLKKIPVKVKNKIATTYNSTLKNLGDDNPDFLAAVEDLTASECAKFDVAVSVPGDVYCQSVGSVMPKASRGKFPLNFSYHLVKYFDGANDGLVSEDSFEWGEKYTLLRPSKKRGISHGDMVDLNRENIDGFDVREFYVELVSDLKNRGL